MPTTYAHWRFGDRCIKTLPDNLQEIINNNRAIFNYGVHGPDIFFYYNCIKHNSVNQFGSNLHDIPFKDTIEKMRPHYLKAEDKKSVLSYLLGFTCHFMLDSYCHGYIDKIDQTTDVTHGKIESQLDRYFMIKDGLNPLKKDRSDSLKPGRRIAHDISTIFPEYSDEIIYQCLKDQVKYCKLLNDSNSIKRYMLIKTMDLFKVPAFKELLLTGSNDSRVKPFNLRIDKYFEKAAEHYPLIAKSLVKFLERGNELDPYFANHFNPKPDYMDIPILDYEKELNYIVDFQK